MMIVGTIFVRRTSSQHASSVRRTFSIKVPSSCCSTRYQLTEGGAPVWRTIVDVLSRLAETVYF